MNGSNYKIIFCNIIICILSLSTLAQTYQTGRRTINYQDASRSRAVATELYYPADAAGINVPVASGIASFPVVIFGHGFVIPISSYAWLGDSLAKAGYILAMPSTEGNVSPSHSLFAGDLAFLAQRITSLNDSAASFLYGRVVKRSAIGGHSMGGGSSFLAMANNNAANALFNFAAAETNPSAKTAALSVNKPSLVFSGSNDCIAPPSDQQTMYNNIAYPCKTYININNALHCQFANNNGTCAFGQITSGCNSSSITPTVVFQKAISVLVPFLNSYLKGDCLTPEFINAYNNLTGVTSVRTCVSDPQCLLVAVQLFNVEGSKQGNHIVIGWQTGQEDNIRRYIVEKSRNGITFTDLFEIASQNNPSGYHYHFVDDHCFEGTNFYRVTAVGYNGSIVRSAVIAVESGAGIRSPNIFPNPANTDFNIIVHALARGEADLCIYDAVGRLIVKTSVLLNYGNNLLPVNNHRFSKGNYFVRVTGKTGVLLRESFNIE